MTSLSSLASRSLRMIACSFVLAVAPGLGGCFYGWTPGISGGPNPSDNGGVANGVAELLVQLTYNGQSSCVTAGIDTLQVTFSGADLSPSTVPCDSQLTGLRITELPVQPLSVTVNGLQSGQVIMSATQSVKLVAGFNRASMNLVPPASTTATTGSLIVNVEFSGQSSCAIANVDHVRISSPDGVFASEIIACGTTPVQITIAGLPAGSLALEVDGLAHQVIIYKLSESVTIALGSNTITANLKATSGTTTSITAGFIFGAPVTTDPTPPGMDCTQAGVQSVSATIDTGTPVVVPCVDANGDDEANIRAAVGVHNVVWNAYASVDGSGTALYSTTSQGVVVQAGVANPVYVDMAGTENGGLTVTWTFPASGTCATVGAATVTYDLADAVGNEVSGFPATVPCSTAMFSASSLVPGVYVLTSMAAKDANSTTIGTASSVRLYAPAGENAPFTVSLKPFVMP